jgi:hypothetical protein
MTQQILNPIEQLSHCRRMRFSFTRTPNGHDPAYNAKGGWKRSAMTSRTSRFTACESAWKHDLGRSVPNFMTQ